MDLQRSEYLSRIHRVKDHIEANLDQELSLEELAKVACFSRFHFHRIFTAMTGESLYQFILRLRLHRAAQQLAQNPRKSITAIALDCGFGSSATFARAFRAGFGMSARQWREQGSKKCKTFSKDCKEPQLMERYGCCLGAIPGAHDNQPWRDAMLQNVKMVEAQSVRVESIDAWPVAYVRHVGPYAGDAALFGRLIGKLMGWAGPRGLIRGPETRMLTIYHDNPEITDQDKLRISVCITVPPGTPVDGEIGSMVIPAGKYAFARFEVDSSEFGGAWNWVYGKWLPESGYQPDDRPCFELCLNDPETHPQKKHVVEICAPVMPL